MEGNEQRREILLPLDHYGLHRWYYHRRRGDKVLESLAEMLEMAMILMCIILLFLFVLIKRQDWGKYSLNDQETMIFIYRTLYSRNFRTLLLLSLLLIPIGGLFLTSVNGFHWHFFATAEVALIFLYFIHREWQNIIGKFGYSKPITQKKPSLRKYILSRGNKVFWLYIGFIGLIVFLSINVIYHFNNLFSPNSDVEREFIVIIINFISIGVIAGLLSILPSLGDFTTRIKQRSKGD